MPQLLKKRSITQIVPTLNNHNANCPGMSCLLRRELPPLKVRETQLAPFLMSSIKAAIHHT